MDGATKIALGVGAALALYLGWKHFQAPAQQVAPETAGGNAVSSMTAAAARSTVYTAGKPILAGIIWHPATRIAKPVPMINVYTPPSIVQSLAMRSGGPVNATVVNALNAPLPNAPSPNANHWNATGILSLGGLQPAGNIPRPIKPAGVS
jgi:hypothetical protein